MPEETQVCDQQTFIKMKMWWSTHCQKCISGCERCIAT